MSNGCDYIERGGKCIYGDIRAQRIAASNARRDDRDYVMQLETENEKLKVEIAKLKKAIVSWKIEEEDWKQTEYEKNVEIAQLEAEVLELQEYRR